MKKFKDTAVYVHGYGIVKTDISFDTEIKSIGGAEEDAEVISLPENCLVVPGFIDIHVHGADGADVMDGTQEALKSIDSALAREGVTRFLATTMTQSKQVIVKALTAAAKYKKEKNCGLLGVHLEGPFISPEYLGAQPEEFISAPDIKLFDKFFSSSDKSILTATVAPEEEGAIPFIKHLKGLGVRVSLGHCGATFEQVQSAIKAGADRVTHTFNAMRGIHHREIGTAGAALLCDELYVELVADGNHVSYPAVKLLVKNKPQDKLILVTDAMRAKGLGDGESELGGQVVFVKNGEARLKDGTFAGSVLKVNEAVKNLVNNAGVTIERAVDCATVNPANYLGLKKHGSIAVGNFADFTVLSPDFRVLTTVRGGEIIYKNF